MNSPLRSILPPGTFRFMLRNSKWSHALIALISFIHASTGALGETVNSRTQTDTNIDGVRPGKGKVVSDSWYTLTINKNVHYGYYNEVFEKIGDRLHFQQHYWKQEEGYINEENLGAFCEDTPELKPLFFNFQSNYRSSETVIDGTVDKGSLSVKVRKSGKDFPIIKRTLGKNVFFSVFFPIWLNMNLSKLKPGQTVSFQSILEDNIDLAFEPVSGHVRLEKSDEFALKTHSKKVLVDFRNLRSIWWVNMNDEYLKIEMPAQNMVIERVSPETAKKFLDVK